MQKSPSAFPRRQTPGLTSMTAAQTTGWAWIGGGVAVGAAVLSGVGAVAAAAPVSGGAVAVGGVGAVAAAAPVTGGAVALTAASLVTGDKGAGPGVALSRWIPGGGGGGPATCDRWNSSIISCIVFIMSCIVLIMSSIRSHVLAMTSNGIRSPGWWLLRLLAGLRGCNGGVLANGGVCARWPVWSAAGWGARATQQSLHT